MNVRRMLFAIVLLLTIGVVNTSAQTRIVTGTVTDALSNDPIVGATVTVEGTTISTLTGPDGTFTLGAPPGAVQIVIRIIGYKRTEIVVGANQSSVTAPLASDVLRLDEIVVSGQATGIDRRNLPNGISTVSAEELSRAPAESVERILAGRVAGANIQTNSGAPGGGISVELRGTTSFISRSPLYVVDGVIMSDVAIPSNINEVTDAAGGSNPSLTQDNQVNRIADLNPADIETVEILKGASASAIYGSKASNGVIIITTKRGQAGRPRIQMNTRFGFFDLDNTLTRQFSSAQEVDEVWGAGTAEQFNFDPARNVERDLAGRNALSFEVGGSVSGGNANTQYFVSGVWKEDEGIMENTGFDKQSVRINLNQAIGDRIRLSFNTNFVHTLGRRGISNNDNSGTSPWFVLASTPRFVDLTADQDGSFPSNSFERSNPIQTMALMQNDEDVWRMVGAFRFEADLIRHNNGGLQFLWASGVDRFSQENSLLFPPELQFEPDDGLPGTSLLSNSNNVNINLNGNLVYRRGFNNSRVNTTTSGGLQYETRELNVSRVTTRNLLPNQSNINQGSTVSVAETKARVEDFGLYIQEEVLIDERLLLTAGIRGDQSSANTQDDKLFWFPKAAASYRIPINGGIFEEIKFRGAYGESGNQPLFGAKFSPLEGRVNAEGILGLQVPAGISNQIVVTDIRPERQREFELGTDITFGNSRASLEATVFQKRVSDLLLPRQLAPSTGFTQEIFNGGNMRVNGIEASVGLVPVQTASASWIVRTTFGATQSKITDLPVPAFIPQNAGFGADLGSFRIEEGKSATQIIGNIPDGLGGASLGEIGDSNPDFRLGFSSDFQIGSFGLFGLVDYQQGGDIVNLTRLLFDSSNNSKDCTTDASNPCADRLNSFSTNTAVYIESATFVKLRELTLSWQLPSGLTSSLWGAIDNARITASGRNLFTSTDFSGMDPEVSNFGNQSIGRNIDVAPFPRSRSFWFGLDLGF